MRQGARRWLASVEGEDDGHLGPAEAIEQGAELTKDALRIIAAAAPEPVAQNEVVKALTDMGYKATDATQDGLVDGLGPRRGADRRQRCVKRAPGTPASRPCTR